MRAFITTKRVIGPSIKLKKGGQKGLRGARCNPYRIPRSRGRGKKSVAPAVRKPDKSNAGSSERKKR